MELKINPTTTPLVRRLLPVLLVLLTFSSIEVHSQATDISPTDPVNVPCGPSIEVPLVRRFDPASGHIYNDCSPPTTNGTTALIVRADSIILQYQLSAGFDCMATDTICIQVDSSGVRLLDINVSLMPDDTDPPTISSTMSNPHNGTTILVCDSPTFFPEVGFMDNCMGALTYDTMTATSDSTAPNCYTRTYMITATDQCGRISEPYIHTLVVNDTVGPEFDIGYNLSSNDTLIIPLNCINDTLNSSSTLTNLWNNLRDQNCGGMDTVYISTNDLQGGMDAPDEGICPLNFLRTLTYIAEDDCGNADTITFEERVRGPRPNLGPDRFSCLDSWTFTSGVGLCQIDSFVWEVVEGLGTMVDSSNHARAEYCPIGVEELGDTVTIAYHAYPRNTACEIVSDTVRLLIQVPCFNCLEELNVSCGQKIRIRDIIQRQMDSCQEATFDLTLINNLGQTLPNPLPGDFTGEFWAFVTSKWTGQFCEALGVVSDKGGCTIQNTLDTAIWCIDDFLAIDPASRYYRDTLDLDPIIVEDCSGDTLDHTFPFYDDEWTQSYDCGDTLKLVTRRWYYSKGGEVCEGYDSIAVIRLPDLTDYLHVPQKDTVMCVYDTINEYTLETSYLSWKHLLGLHSDTVYITYPLDSDIHTDIKDILDSVANITDADLRDSIETFLRSIAVVRDWSTIQQRYHDYNIYDIAANENNLFPVSWTGNDSVVSFIIGENDQFLTNGGAYVTVDSNWFYRENDHGFWVDLSLPIIGYDIHSTICDTWDYNCRGAEVVLPNTPYNADSCIHLCLEDLPVGDKCIEVVHIEEKNLGGSCPTVNKYSATIKQSCVATGVAVLDNLPKCTYPLPVNNTGIVQSTTFGDGVHIEISQWRLHIDTLGPLIGYEKEKEFAFSTDEHSCMGDLDLPGIWVKDLCSGVKNVKATVGEDNPWILFEDGDEDGYWTPVESSRNIRLACGERYRVNYELLDSCHNLTETSRHWVEVVDRTSPVIITNDTFRVSIGSKEIALDASVFNTGTADNCAIVKQYVRRPDWIEACGVDVCVDAISEITSKQELEDFLEEYGYLVGLDDNSVERYYARQYEWLVDESDFCDNKDFKDLLIRGWQEDIKAAWAEECGTTDEHGNSLFEPSSEFHLGGGWGEQLQLCCEDACQQVVVEILAIDKSCNYTKSWAIIDVEDKSTISKACEFDDITMSCHAFATYYADIAHAAATGDPDMLDSLDVLLGDLKKGWRSADNQLVTYDGDLIDKNFEVYSSTCRLEPHIEKRFDTLHDGEIIWVTDTTFVRTPYIDTLEVQLGGIYQLCGSTCERDVWIELDDCGVGTITRRWLVYGGCSGDSSHSSGPLVLTQTIHVQPDCELDKYSFDVPSDTLICSELIYNISGNVFVDGGELEYISGEDLSTCRQLGIGYEDQLFAIDGEPNMWKVHRIWRVNDWCSGAEIICPQKIIIQTDGCSTQDTASRAADSGGLEFQLFQNRPNPFVEECAISFVLPQSGAARLTLFDVHGKVLWESQRTYPSGLNSEIINTSELGLSSSGVIFYMLETDHYSATKQMILLR